jgi:hypothetical protein
VSFDYYVAVRRQDWPTAASVQSALEVLGYPLRLADAPPTPFAVAHFKEGLPVEFEGKPVLLEADIEQATDADDPESLYGYIAECAAQNFKISNDDYFLTLTFRSDADQIRAGLYLAATIILAFNGYGFENQFESHGSEDFADKLLSEASDAAAFERPVPEVWLNPDSRPPGETPDKELAFRKPSILDRFKSYFGIK